jgi:hypothetical protein
MDWQLALVLLCVAGAALFLGWSACRGIARARAGCRGCGCTANKSPAAAAPKENSPLIAPESLAAGFRRRPTDEAIK